MMRNMPIYSINVLPLSLKTSLGTDLWNKIKPVSPIPVIYNHTTVKLADSLFVYGGQNQSGLTKQLLEYKISKLFDQYTPGNYHNTPVKGVSQLLVILNDIIHYEDRPHVCYTCKSSSSSRTRIFIVSSLI